jgi:hypothetical protein
MRSPVGGGSAEAITHDVAAGRIVDLALILIGALIDPMATCRRDGSNPARSDLPRDGLAPRQGMRSRRGVAQVIKDELRFLRKAPSPAHPLQIVDQAIDNWRARKDSNL